MENKKLLNYLLKDLSELDELFAEKENKSFDDLEMEFLQNRIKGAMKLVQILSDRQNGSVERKPDPIVKNQTKVHTESIKIPEEKIAIEIKEELIEDIVVDKIEEVAEPKIDRVEIEEEIQETVDETNQQKIEEQAVYIKNEELELEEEEIIENPNKRLGDSFSKEKSVNDLISADNSKLEHKLSNRPVNSIQTSIGINDRFQYIRELFEGSADNYATTVKKLDSMNEIKEAVNYLQQNFKWKKNETSLKFVNLVKRRFPNE